MQVFPKKISGFTLIELSIVLVIIGLISAGVLVGRDMIRAAEIRAQIAQIEKMNTAANTFHSKYNCLPGDCAMATQYDLGTVGGDGDNGNGNGIIDIGADPSNNPIGIETQHFWYHLGRANLIDTNLPVGPVPGINSPPLKFRGDGIAGTPNPAGGMWILNSMTIRYEFGGAATLRPVWILASRTSCTDFGCGPSGDGRSAGVYEPIDTYAMDIKMDDGFPLSGMFQIGKGPASLFFENGMAVTSYETGFGAVGDCYNPTTTPYSYNMKASMAQIHDNTRKCMPIIKTSF